MATNGMFAYEKIILKQSDLSRSLSKLNLFKIGQWHLPNQSSTVWHLYRSQTKFAKGMFSHMSVCPQGGVLVCVQGGLHLGGLCPGGSMLGGVCVQEVLCRGGSVSRGSVSSGVCVQGGLCPGGVSVRESPHTVTSGQYASYWNAFLFRIFLCNLN